VKLIICLCVFGLSLGMTHGAAADDRIKLNIKLCHTAPREVVEPLAVGWQQMLPYSHVCPLYGKNGKLVLWILTVPG
jgi:hypothetical protein